MPEVINPAAETSAETVDSPEKFKTRGREVIENYTLEQLEAYIREQKAEIARLEQENESLETQEFALETSVNFSDIDRTRERTKKNPGAKKFFTMKTALVTAAVVAALALFGGTAVDSSKNEAVETQPSLNSPGIVEIQPSASPEVDILRLDYDYSHWQDFENKSSHNAYDYDYSDCFNDDTKTKQEWLNVAKRIPEALASYAYYVFSDQEKAELGISGLSETEIDDLMNESNPESGNIQKRLLSALEGVMGSEDTELVYYLENDTENTYYIYFVDSNKDGKITPDEMHLGYSTVKRNNAKQVDIYRNIDGSRVKVLDLNMYCGFQPNTEVPPEGIPFMPSEEDSRGDDPTPPTITPTAPPTTPPGTQPPREWGKSGDPRGGDLVGVSEQVNPQSEVTRAESEEVNSGNQGYKNDNQAAPGASSESNGINESGFSGSEVKAEGASTDSGSRLSGGENQSSGINGNNSQNPNNEGRVVDNSGNSAQSIAQASGGENNNGATPGGNNYSDAGEVAAVENGDF